MGAGAAGRVRSGGAQCRRDRHIHRRAEANGTMAAAADSEVEEVASAQNPLHARSQQGSLSLELEGGFVCDDDV